MYSGALGGGLVFGIHCLPWDQAAAVSRLELAPLWVGAALCRRPQPPVFPGPRLAPCPRSPRLLWTAAPRVLPSPTARQSPAPSHRLCCGCPVRESVVCPQAGPVPLPARAPSPRGHGPEDRPCGVSCRELLSPPRAPGGGCCVWVSLGWLCLGWAPTICPQVCGGGWLANEGRAEVAVGERARGWARGLCQGREDVGQNRVWPWRKDAWHLLRVALGAGRHCRACASPSRVSAAHSLPLTEASPLGGFPLAAGLCFIVQVPGGEVSCRRSPEVLRKDPVPSPLGICVY